MKYLTRGSSLLIVLLIQCLGFASVVSAVENDVHQILDEFLIAAMLEDEEKFENTLDPSGKISLKVEEELLELNIEEMKQEFFHATTENDFRERKITIDGDTAIITGKWFQGNPRRDIYEPLVIDANIVFSKIDESWYISEFDVIDADILAIDHPPYPGTLITFETDYYIINYPPVWEVEHETSEPTGIFRDIHWASFRGTNMPIVASLDVFETDFDSFIKKVEEEIESETQAASNFELIARQEFEINGQHFVKIHISRDDFRGDYQEIVRIFVANENVFVKLSARLHLDNIDFHMEKLKAIMNELILE